ncbi:uncharacterized protein LOC130697282 [Daphnia carinata]|uniref:uncharacterized protein LOC130697282 n=1 Tax=Daphnia carinata TaxID=120202 RepID=UPI00257EEAF1|nr:uncharacterized protein LOC130697282 [Daphnia carinata]
MALSKEDLSQLLLAQQQLFAEQQHKLLEEARADSARREELLLRSLSQLHTKMEDETETASDLILSALSKRIPEFTFEPENGCTFHVWYQRFEDVMSQEGSKLKQEAQARFLITKLDAACYARLVDKILPKKPTELNLKEAVEILEKMFEQKMTTFRKRYDCFKVIKPPTQDYATFSTLVNRKCERAQLNQMSDDDFKCLVFVSGLQSPEDAEMRTRLLRKLEQSDRVTLDELVAECELVLALKKDAKLIEQSTSQVQAIKKNQKRRSKEVQRMRPNLKRRKRWNALSAAGNILHEIAQKLLSQRRAKSFNIRFILTPIENKPMRLRVLRT